MSKPGNSRELSFLGLVIMMISASNPRGNVKTIGTLPCGAVHSAFKHLLAIGAATLLRNSVRICGSLFRN
jgi:hypothetical protein